MPITEAMSQLLKGETDAKSALRALMTRELKVESEL
jgi:glycerol-3-phosphate dehydrogenase